MKKVIVCLLVVTLSLSLFASCDAGSENKGNGVLKVFNWGDYIDPSVTKLFEERTGIEVIYSMYETNEDMYTSVSTAAGPSYDIVFPSDYMIRRMINEDLLAEINLDNIPNYQHIDDRFKNLAFDPDNAYSVPYMWGTVGIVYNTTMVHELVTSWTALWDTRYEKNMFMMDSVRDSFGLTLKMLDYSMNTKDEAELEEAYNKLAEQKPLVLAYTGDEVKDKMIAGEAALAVVYSGDAVTIMDENEEIEYVVPSEGSNVWFDGVCILKNAENVENAEKFIDFLCSQEIAELNRAYINFSTPQKQVIDALPEEVASDPAQNPDQAIIDRCEVFEDLANSTAHYEELWVRLISQ